MPVSEGDRSMPVGEEARGSDGIWDPWRALGRRHDVDVRLDAIAGTMGGAVLVQMGDRAAIVIDPRLGPSARRVALAHELVHLERGGGCDRPDAPDGWDAVVARDEAAVDREVARRLVPAEALDAWLRERGHLADGVTPGEVAEAFGVTPALAERALHRLAGTLP